jgi:hypothetical protein
MSYPTADSDRVYSAAELEFLQAIQQWKRTNHKQFPSWRDVLGVLLSLGYRKVAPPEETPRDAGCPPR